jgi:hypothetical protein
MSSDTQGCGEMTGHTALTHKVARLGQKQNDDAYHHPEEKISQLEELKDYISGDILEVFAGQGNLTEWYKNRGTVTPLTKETTGDSFLYIYQLRVNKKKYDWIDIDSYGYPDKFFPVVFEMMNETCGLVFTFPQVGTNCLNGITQQHFSTFYGNPSPTIGDVVGKITDWALREWYLASLVDVKKISRIYRFAFMCKRVMATKMTNVRNR